MTTRELIKILRDLDKGGKKKVVLSVEDQWTGIDEVYIDEEEWVEIKGY